MQRTFLKAKLHRATVTQAELDYVGSITIDEDLLDLVDIKPYELVHVLNINNGSRFETYAIKGERGSGMICVNGAAARLVQPGDKVIILSYALLDDTEVDSHTPRLAILTVGNQVDDLIDDEVNEEDI